MKVKNQLFLKVKTQLFLRDNTEKYFIIKNNLKGKGRTRLWVLSFVKKVFLSLFFRILYQGTQDAAALGQHQAGGVGFVAALSSPGERC